MPDWGCSHNDAGRATVGPLKAAAQLCVWAARTWSPRAERTAWTGHADHQGRQAVGAAAQPSSLKPVRGDGAHISMHFSRLVHARPLLSPEAGPARRHTCATPARGAATTPSCAAWRPSWTWSTAAAVIDYLVPKHVADVRSPAAARTEQALSRIQESEARLGSPVSHATA